MPEQLKSVILDFQEMPLAPGEPRRLDVQPVPGKASSRTGVRRSGKSTCLRQRMQRLADSGVSRRNILYLNFFDDRLSPLAEMGPGPALEAYFFLFPEKKVRKRFTASSTRSRPFRAGSLLWTGRCAPKTAKSGSPGLPPGCCPEKSPPRCADARFHGKSSRKCAASLNKSNASPKKIYCIDHAMVTSVASGALVNSGHPLENLVFGVLRRQYPQICYYKTQSNKEADFLALGDRGGRRLVQVYETLADPKTRKRELDALTEGMRELGLKKGVIVTRGAEEKISVDGGNVEVVPA